MSSEKLKKALHNCLISFDHRVLVTDLLQEYALPYSTVQTTLVEHLQQQEQKHGTKYDKRFLVHGEEDCNAHKEIYTVVQGEQKLKDWLAKLKNSESSLYSVEVAGGAKVPAQIFKPLIHCEVQMKDLVERTNGVKTNENVKDAAQNATVESKPEIKTNAKKLTPFPAVDKKPTGSSTSSGTIAESSNKSNKSPQESKKSTPEDKKTIKHSFANSNKKGIGNFFAANTKKDEPKEDAKSKGVLKPPTPKKMQDFFKKQPEKNPTQSPKKEANTSMQLFAADDEEDVEAQQLDSSDDEEAQIAALKREVKSDNEDEAASTSSTSKRRRILDSDDEDEEPHKKFDKKEPVGEEASENVLEVEDEPASETFLDDDGFVITVKPKKKSSMTVKPAKLSNKSAKKASPPSKSPLKSAAKGQSKAAPSSKTKQGNIMSFFTKK